MKVLITGSKGFLGRHIARYFREMGDAVVSFDLVDGQDLLEEKTLFRSMRGVESVVHLAAVGDVYQAARDPVQASISGLAGTANLVKVANRRGIGKIVYASTWEVYGEPQYEPLDEKHPCNPDHPYSIAKYAGELMVRNTLNRVPWLILRLGSAYGTGMRPHAVIPLFIRKALDGESITLQNGGIQLRQFTHTRDVGSAFFKAVHAPVSGEIFNIVDRKPHSIRDIAQYVTSRIPARLVVGPKREGDVPSARVACAKAQRMLKWKAEVSLHEGIDELISSMEPIK